MADNFSDELGAQRRQKDNAPVADHGSVARLVSGGVGPMLSFPFHSSV